MAIDTEGGLRVFSGASKEAAESAVNTFLAGDSTIQNPKKFIVQAPQFVISGGTFYICIVYDTVR